MYEICLRVINTQKLDDQYRYYHIFNQNGGTIGSALDNTWTINDKNNQIQNIHAVISYDEEIFGLKTYSKECLIFFGDSFSAISASYEIQIQKGDYFRIGDLKIEVIDTKTFYQQNEKKIHSFHELGDLDLYKNINTTPLKHEEKESNTLQKNSDILQIDTILGLDSTINSIEEKPLQKEIQEKNYNLSKNENHSINSKNLQKLILETIQKLQTQIPTTQIPNSSKNILTISELQIRIQRFCLTQNKEIINLLILSIIYKNLNSPIFEEIYPDIFERTISEIIQDCIDGRNHKLEKILLMILQEYHQT